MPYPKNILPALMGMLIANSLLLSDANAAVWPDHVATAQTYVSQIQANNNSYGSPATLAYDATQILHAQTQCSTFINLLLKNTYPGIVTNQALIALTGNSSPYADQWFTAIQNGAVDPGSKLTIKNRATIASMKVGDIIASSYTTSGNTGHIMTVEALNLAEANIAPPYPIPGIATVNRYLAKIYDSTKSPHGNYWSNLNQDSRYNKQWNGTSWIADEGLGYGYIALYEDSATGKPVAWAWNTSKTTKSFYYAVTPPEQSILEYRPLAIGYLTGL